MPGNDDVPGEELCSFLEGAASLAALRSAHSPCRQRDVWKRSLSRIRPAKSTFLCCSRLLSHLRLRKRPVSRSEIAS